MPDKDNLPVTDQYIAQPDAEMGGVDVAGRTVSPHEYGGNQPDKGLSDAQTYGGHNLSDNEDATTSGVMGSVYDMQQQTQGGHMGSGANTDTSADMDGLNRSDGGATYSGAGNTTGGMLGPNEPGATMHSGPAGGGAVGGQLGDGMGQGSVQGGTVGKAMTDTGMGAGTTGVSSLAGGDMVAGANANRSNLPTSNDHNQPPAGESGDDRDSTIGDAADSGGRHDNPHDSLRYPEPDTNA